MGNGHGVVVLTCRFGDTRRVDISPSPVDLLQRISNRSNNLPSAAKPFGCFFFKKLCSVGAIELAHMIWDVLTVASRSPLCLSGYGADKRNEC
jgi:hypothetical protein